MWAKRSLESRVLPPASHIAAHVAKITAVALNAYKESVRDKVFYGLVLFALLVVVAAILLGQLSVGQGRKILVDVGLSAIRFFGSLIAIFSGIGLVQKEIERRTIYSLLAKPLERWQLVVGKFLGGSLTVLVSVVVMTAVLLGVLAYVTRGFTALHLIMLPAIVLIYLQLLVTTSLALVVSTFSTPILSAVLTFFFVLIGHGTGELADLATSVQSSALAIACRVLYYTLPNFQNFNFTLAVAHGQAIAPELFGKVVAYALVYLAILLLLATFIFERREFK